MRKFYYKYFHIPKHGKIKDNVMLIRTAATAVMMVICLAVMSFTAYAYFSHNVTSVSNRIQTANFSADVSVSVTEGETCTLVEPQKTRPAYTFELESGKIYSVTVSYGESTASTGFCVITAKNCPETYHTQQLWKNPTPSEGKLNSVTFLLTVNKKTTVEILSYWGTSSRNGNNDEWYICDGETVNINVSDEVIHTVVSGETLSGIAAKYGVPVDQIVACNEEITDPNKITVGQMLKIPSAESRSTDSEANGIFSSFSQESNGSGVTDNGAADVSDGTDAPASSAVSE